MTTVEARMMAHSQSAGKQLQWMNHLVCFTLSVTLFTAAIAKTRSLSELESTLVASHLVPVLLVSPAAVLLVVMEYLLAFLLVLTPTRRPALYLSTVLVSVFAAYSTWRWMQGIAVPCHCFGTIFQLTVWQSLFLNGCLLGLIASQLAQYQPRIKSTHAI